MQEQEKTVYHVLDDKKRAEIIGLLTVGCSRRKAAQYVGCAPSTITRAVCRDPEFAAQVARAEQNIETLALANIRAACKQERYWRASAWVLEHRNPEDFATRPPDVMTPDKVNQLLTQFAEVILCELPLDLWHRVTTAIDNFMKTAQQEVCDSQPCQAQDASLWSPAPSMNVSAANAPAHSAGTGVRAVELGPLAASEAEAIDSPTQQSCDESRTPNQAPTAEPPLPVRNEQPAPTERKLVLAGGPAVLALAGGPAALAPAGGPAAPCRPSTQRPPNGQCDFTTPTPSTTPETTTTSPFNTRPKEATPAQGRCVRDCPNSRVSENETVKMGLSQPGFTPPVG